jgi:peroxiredoxin Q/BCP
MLEPGTEAPAFALNDQHGDVLRSSDLRGKWVVMWWYPKASTPG